MSTAEPDWKEYVEPLLPDPFGEPRQTFWSYTCPSCGYDVHPFITDGPDPAFAEVQCPRPDCNHEWQEQVA